MREIHTFRFRLSTFHDPSLLRVHIGYTGEWSIEDWGKDLGGRELVFKKTDTNSQSHTLAKM